MNLRDLRLGAHLFFNSQGVTFLTSDGVRHCDIGFIDVDDYSVCAQSVEIMDGGGTLNRFEYNSSTMQIPKLHTSVEEAIASRDASTVGPKTNDAQE